MQRLADRRRQLRGGIALSRIELGLGDEEAAGEVSTDEAGAAEIGGSQVSACEVGADEVRSAAVGRLLPCQSSS